MKIFKDNTGREWQLVLNVYAMKQIRAKLGIDLINVIQLDKSGNVKVDLIDQIANDPCLLVDILWVLCEEQAKVLNVTDVAFGSALAGDAIEDATKAFLDELVDFFPEMRRRKCRGIPRHFRREAAQTEGRAHERRTPRSGRKPPREACLKKRKKKRP